MNERFSFPGKVAFVAIASLTVFMLGCGGGPSGPTGELHGKVTFQGEPVPEGAMITFIGADDPTASASARIGAGGEYSMDSGILIGTYRVSISPPSDTELSPENAMMNTEAAKKNNSASVSELSVDSYPNIPLKYRNPADSPETCEIKKGDNTYDLDMTN